MADAPETTGTAAADEHGGDAKGKDKGKKGKGGAPGAKPNMIVLIALIAGPLLLGGGAGAFLLGPKLLGAKSAGAAEKKPKKKKEKKEGKHGGEGERSPVFKIDNLIVNPAGSAGGHFLMTQIAIECEDEKQVALLRANEDKVKDLIISQISSQTLEQLTMPGARDSIKVRILNAVSPLVYTGGTEGADAQADAEVEFPHTPLQVYLPQFVIQ